MRSHPFNPRRCPGKFLALAGVAWLAVGGYCASAQEEGSWIQHFRAGVLAGFNIKADFKVDGQFGISGSRPGATGVPGVDHYYDDGYVLRDATGNAGGYTSYWGYNNAAQYDGSSETLTLHSGTSYTAAGGASEDESPYIGFEMAYGMSPWRWGQVELGWEFGFGFLPIEISDTQNLDTSVNRTVHSFATGGILVPTAPYNGGPSGIGPTILDVASPEPGDTVNGIVTGSRAIDVNLYALKLGPTIGWRPHPRVGLSVSAGPALGILAGDLRINETIRLEDGSSTRNRGSTGVTELLFGGYVSGLATFGIVENGDLYLGVQYLPLGTTKFSGTGRTATLDLGGGILVSGGINWPF